MNIKKERVLLRPSDLISSDKRLKIIGTLNPAAVRMDDGKILLYVRVIEKLKKFEDKKYVYAPRLDGKKKYKLVIDKFKKKDVTGFSHLDIIFRNGTKRLNFISHLRKVILDEKGFNVLEIDEKPTFYGLKEESELSVEDPRFTKLEKKYYMTYVGLSRENNISTYLAESKDLKKWKRLGIIFGEQDKDVVLFPEKVRGKYVVFDRPEGSFQFSPPHIWIAYSDEKLEWGKLKSVHLSKIGDYDHGRKGAGPPPIKTKKGWLLIYHSVIEYDNILDKKAAKKHIEKGFGKTSKQLAGLTFYCMGAALFDLKNPSKLIARNKYPLIYPNKRYCKGFEDKQIFFPTGVIEDGEDLLIYSGAGDVCTMVSKINLKELLKTLKKV
jgi:predicted GH43/DUF377 family glycosyl hydrolase